MVGGCGMGGECVWGDVGLLIWVWCGNVDC